ncbi:Pls/PosA family non-ribosomal peptide synthetase [Corynebacterium cystitidis]|uniref:Pls/PosA family non-ribosomal peptide synthetase n=1 Tax=Corynebacterium cystitidis TaxID=35757 RepID=UPI00211E2370|nr:Pls/PosA family non-ribosomal peptide synthetase [Corynebacterium cystitidis]
MADADYPIKFTPNDHPDFAVFGAESKPKKRTLVDIARATMEAYPDSVALESEDETLTYSELEDRVTRQVERLHSLGIGRGARIGIRVRSGTTDLYVAILSAIFAGAAYVPVDWDDPDSRATTVWEEADVDAVFGAGLSIEKHKSHDIDAVDTSEPALDDDAWIIFTSGSTGKPKGVAIRHHSAAALVDAEQLMFLQDAPLGPGDRVMAGLSVAFDASCEEMWLAWRTGATLVCAHRDIVRSGDVLNEWLTAKQISAISTVPTLASFWSKEALENIRLLIFGGEALPLELVARLEDPKREIWNTYGPTEATVIGAGQLMTSEPPVRIGRPVPGWKLLVVDEDEKPVRWGESGQLIIGGVGLGRYLDPAKDAEVYAPMECVGWERAYRTGDLVKAERDGLIFQGRVDDQIKFAGRRMELGEIDDKLNALSHVSVGACRLNKTEAGNDVLVGYLVEEPGEEIDLHQAREELSETMPGGIVPVLHVMDSLPTKTSGKVDRKALPWPLPFDGTSESNLPPEMGPLAEAWRRQLGPMPLTQESNFFELGGSSIAIAHLVTELRHDFPTADIGELYANPTLAEMHAYLHTLEATGEKREMPQPMPFWGKIFQALWIVFMVATIGLRYATSALIIVWILSVVFNAAWVPQPPFIPLFIAWLLFYAPFGKIFVTAGIVRMLTAGIKPGTYRKGGWVHMRVWAAERFFNLQSHDTLDGTPLAQFFYRILGNKIGRNVTLNSSLSLIGLVTLGDHVAIEDEVDMSGYWIEGDNFYIGTIFVGEYSRIGTRSFVSPNVVLERNVEILPGSRVEEAISEGEMWEGAPMRYLGPSNQNWPQEDPDRTPNLGAVGRVINTVLYSLGMLLVNVLPIFAIAPVAVVFMIATRVLDELDYRAVFVSLAVWAIPVVIASVVCWLSLVAFTVRMLALFIRPGFWPARSVTSWALWLTRTLMANSLESTYFIYASWLTPYWLRMCGATVGKDAEISTVVVIPHLTHVSDHAFLADDVMICAPRYGRGWVHIGSTFIGEKSFVGNSAIIGADRDLAGDSLLAALSTSPYKPEPGSSWMGRTPTMIPRKKEIGEASATYRPTFQRRIGRAFFESLRVFALVISFWIDTVIVYAMTTVYVEGGQNTRSLLLALAASVPCILIGFTFSSLIPVIAKWFLVGKFRVGQQELHSSFVWRNELADNFNEVLAVPTLIAISLGTPFFNIWARLMGAKIGKDVWCETWWLPEFDLIELEDHSTVNRGTVLQTHLFHDRVMSLESVSLATGSTLGPDSFILPGASIGERTTIGPASLVLRQDQVPSDTLWEGNPISLTSSNKYTAADLAVSASTSDQNFEDKSITHAQFSGNNIMEVTR